MKFYIPPQLKRLFIAFAVFISLFLVARHFLRPASFGQYGFYRGASLAESAAFPIHYAGQTACLECHQKEAARRGDVIVQQDLATHNPGKDCIECHNPHQPWKEKK